MRSSGAWPGGRLASIDGGNIASFTVWVLLANLSPLSDEPGTLLLLPDPTGARGGIKQMRFDLLLMTVVVAASLSLGGCQTASDPSKLAREQMAMLAEGTADWSTTGGGFDETHFSPLDKINAKNVSELGLAWSFDTNTTRGLEATPVVVDGMLYATGSVGQVYALNAATGEKLWAFEPEVSGKAMGNACCDTVNRGLAVWDGLVYVTVLDGRMFALNARSGKPVWQADTIVDHKKLYTSTGAPRVAGNVVVIGNSGADFDARGYVSAYDLKTGKFRWRFFTVPGDPSKPFEHPELVMASKTWDPKSLWQVGGGGTVWDSMVYDPKLNLLYVGTGNAAVYPESLRSPKGGDNLFLASILAINPDTGRLAWHYQTTPGESWDYTATQPMILADLKIAGASRQVLMQAPKNGYFYVLDRKTGALISAEPYVPMNWSTGIDKKTGRPIMSETANYFTEPKVIWPAAKGGHGWRPMAYSRKTGLVYIPVWEDAELMTNLFPGGYEYRPGEPNGAMANIPLVEAVVDFYAPILPYSAERLKAIIRAAKPPRRRGLLRAWDPVAQKTVWEVEESYLRNGGGVLATAGGLVIQTKASGELAIYDDRSGKLLKSIDTYSGMMAAPSTYSVNGEQYVAVLAGLGGGMMAFPPETAAAKYGNDGRIMAFKLGGSAVPKRDPVVREPRPVPPPMPTDKTKIIAGQKLFIWNCSRCHFNAGPGVVPDLNLLTPDKHQIFDQIVREGLLLSNGMPRFDKKLSKAETDSIHAFLIASANVAYARTATAPRDGNLQRTSQ